VNQFHHYCTLFVTYSAAHSSRTFDLVIELWQYFHNSCRTWPKLDCTSCADWRVFNFG